MIVWFSHPGVMTRRVADVALVVDVLKQRNGISQAAAFAGELGTPRQLRVGVATNFTADSDVAAAFTKAVDTVAGLGYNVNDVVVPFAGPGNGIRHIQRDREAISRRLFDAIDVLLLPTTTTAVLRTTAGSNSQALSPENTVFANYYGLPAISAPSGFDTNGLPLGLQIVARPRADLDALTLAQQYEAAAGLFSRHPIVGNT
jgi:aspartyl-tRNA(Asn)/glutamyl-tRNA(Gln) amidotransferase subunit A